MGPGAELLLKRMSSKPEEFLEGGKWDWALKEIERENSYRLSNPELKMEIASYFDEDELEAFTCKLRDMKRERFHHKIMSILLGA